MTIDEMVKNKSDLIALKKIAVKHSDIVLNSPLKDNEELEKSISLPGIKNDDLQKLIANTYYWLDSHGDVHVKGCFTKTIKENKTKIFHLDNHNSENGFRSKVGNVKDIVEKNIPWESLGIDKEGNTICVIGFTELIEQYNKQVYDAYKSGEIDQHSVGMQYVVLEMAVNNPLYVGEFAIWNEIYPLLGNPEEADKNGYFWVVREAKLKEYSCVLWSGSNSLTNAVSNKDTEAVIDDTLKNENEPSNDTQKTNRRILI